jgi:hypothetical protein
LQKAGRAVLASIRLKQGLNRQTHSLAPSPTS